MIYCIMFIWSIIIIYFCEHIKGHNKPLAKIISGLMIIAFPVILSGLRGNVGTDTLKFYYPYYNRVIVGDATYTGKEYGFYYLCKLVDWFLESYNGLLFIIALLIWGLYIVTIYKDSELKGNFIVAFVGLLALYFAPSLNIMRQSIACAILFFSLKYCERRKFVPFVVTVLIATLFHTSSIFFLTVYFLYTDKDVNVTNFKELFIRGCLIVLPILFPMLFEFFIQYDLFEKYLISYGGTLQLHASFSRIIVRLPIYLFEIITFMKNKDKRSRFYFNLILMEIVCLCFNFYMTWAFRLAYCYSFAHICYCCHYLSITKRNSLRKHQIFSVGLIGYFVLYFLIVHYFWNYDQIFPYLLPAS